MIKTKKIKMTNIRLRKYLANKDHVKIFRKICNEDENLSGFILSMSNKFLLLQLDFDFMFDGFAIIKNHDFDRIRCNSYDKTQKKIFKAEGLLNEEYGLNIRFPLTNWKEILTALKKYDFHIIVENINTDYLDFYIGEIIKVTDKTLSIHNYSPTGKLAKKPSKILLESIRSIKFGDRYSTIFRKYLKTG